MAAAGAIALSVLGPGRLAAVRYAGRPDGRLARLPGRAPRLRRGRRAWPSARCAGAAYVLLAADGEPRGRHRRTAERRQDVGVQRADRRRARRSRRYAAVQTSANVGRRRRARRADRRARRGRRLARGRSPAHGAASPTSRGSCAAPAPETVSAASTSATCVRPTRWPTSCAASTTRRRPPGRPSRSGGRRRDRRPRAAAGGQELVERRRERVARAARVGEKGARDELAALRAPRRPTSTRASPPARSTSRSPRASTC